MTVGKQTNAPARSAVAISHLLLATVRRRSRIRGGIVKARTYQLWLGSDRSVFGYDGEAALNLVEDIPNVLKREDSVLTELCEQVLLGQRAFAQLLWAHLPMLNQDTNPVVEQFQD